MNWRLASRLSVITLAALVVIIVAVLGTRAGGLTSNASNLTPAANSSCLQGTDLGGVPASNFRLIDQFGILVVIALYKGEQVVMIFIYKYCTVQITITCD